MIDDELFVITVHERSHVLEVRYPSRVTMAAFERYVTEVKAAVLLLHRQGQWDCIVDQAALKAMAPDFPPRISELNVWSAAHGMRRTARLIASSAIGELQTLRILKDAGVNEMGAIFHTHQDAWKFVTGVGG